MPLSSRSRRSTWIPASALLGAAALALVALRLLDGAADGAQAPGSEAAAPVTVALVEPGEFADHIEALGTARANESVVITARVTESVARLTFEDGQEVEAGAILAELTSAEEAAQLDAERSLYVEALKQYQRIADLKAQGSAPQSQLDAVTAQRDAARARIAELEARLADRLVRAPFGGVLGLRAVSPGSLVQPGDEITTLDDLDLIKLDFSVPETFLAGLRPGLEIRARSAAWPGRLFAGEVSSVDPRVNPTTRAVRVRAALPNPEHLLRPGMLLAVDLIQNRREALALPEEALVPVGERQFVFVVDGDGRAQRVEIRTGQRRPGAVEVLGGLSAGDRVVIEGGDRLRPGSAVRIAEPPAPAGGA